MVMVGYGHLGEEAVIYVAYFKIICAIGVQRRDKGGAIFHIRFYQKTILKPVFMSRKDLKF